MLLIGGGQLSAISVPKARRISAKTPSQAPWRCWRNNRIDGYQGEVSRPRIQRQSGANGTATQTGLPIAPAKCASAVSTVITKSSCAITAAVSEKSRRRPPRSVTNHHSQTTTRAARDPRSFPRVWQGGGREPHTAWQAGMHAGMVVTRPTQHSPHI